MNEYDTFFRLHSQVHGLYSKNIELEKECQKMEKEISGFKKELESEAKRSKNSDEIKVII